jgi:hypothetical protein
MPSDQLLAGGTVDAIDFVAGDIAEDPLDFGAAAGLRSPGVEWMQWTRSLNGYSFADVTEETGYGLRADS